MFNANLFKLGFEYKKNCIDISRVDSLNQAIDNLTVAHKKGGIRHVDAKCSEVASMINSTSISSLMQSYFSESFTIIRCIFFNKTVAVSNKLCEPSWGPWSMKEGVLHVQPPLDVLQSMITVRINLDDVGVNDGGLEIIPSSHHLGLISQQDISTYVDQHDSSLCTGKKGDALVMRW